MPGTQKRGTPVPGTDVRNQPLKVDFLFWEDCPSHERALQLLRQVLQEEGVEARIDLHRVETDDEAEALRFPGSPTIRVDGADVDDDSSLPVGLSCRMYRHANGKISPLPSKDVIVRAIREAIGVRRIDASRLSA